MAGRICTALTFTDETNTTGTTDAKYPLGTLRIEETSAAVGAETYRYVKFDNGSGNVAAVAGGVCYRGVTQARPWEVTSDVSTVDSAFAAGIFQSVLTDANYGWVKTKGYQSNVKKHTGTGFAWVKGDYIYAFGSSTADQKAVNIKLAATTKVSGAELRKALERGIGWAAAAVSSTTGTGAAYIDLE